MKKKNGIQKGIILGVIVVLFGASYVSGISIPEHNNQRDENLNVYYRGQCDTTYEPTAVHTVGEYCYVTSKYFVQSCPPEFYGVLDIVNVLDTEDPWIEGSYDEFHKALDVYIEDEYAYVLDFPQTSSLNSYLVTVDISETENPQFCDRYDYGIVNYGQEIDVSVQSGYVFVTHNGYLDIFTGPNVDIVYTIPIHDYATDLAVLGDYAYTTSYDQGPRCYLTIVDVSNPFEASTVSDTRIGGSNDIAIADVPVEGQFAYVATHSGLLIFNVSDPTDISAPIEYLTPYIVVDTEIEDHYAYVQYGKQNIVVLDIENPINPQPVGYYNFTDVNITDISVSDNNIYVSLDDWTLQILTFTQETNDPPETPHQPSGETDGSVGVEYTYTTNTTDSNGDNLYYNFSWDDGSYSGWIGPYQSLEDAQASHRWTERGEYEVRVKAKDDGIGGLESDWSESLLVQINGPDLDCDGVLNWEDLHYGETVTGEFTVENIGDPESLLDWEVDSYPDWGIWTFDPETGEDLTPESGEITITVTVTAPEESEQGEEFQGEIKIVNSEDPDDFCFIDTTMTNAVSQHTLLLQFLEMLAQRFPIISYLLSILV